MEVRPATPADVPTLVDVMYAEPTAESIAVAGGADRARAFQQGLFHDVLKRSGNIILVAAENGEILGFAFVSKGADTPPLRDLARLAVRSMGIRGALGAARRGRVRARVELTPPPGGLHLVELQVHPSRRGSGLGGLLIDAAERHARSEGAVHMSLTTASNNPARGLYERHGYAIVDERADAEYAALTGVVARILLLKELS